MKPYILFKDTPPANARNGARRIAEREPPRIAGQEWIEYTDRPTSTPSGGLMVAVLFVACVLLSLAVTLGLMWLMNN